MARKYAWRRQLPDKRDKHFLVVPGVDTPQQADLLDYTPLIDDQGQEGCCTGEGTRFAIDTLQAVTKYPWRFHASRQFIYWNARLLEGTTEADAGANIRDAIAGVNKYGACPEDSNPAWSLPYIAGAYKVPPTAAMYKDAKLHRALKYEAVAQDRNALMASILAKRPIVIGIMVYPSFESQTVTDTGVVSMPSVLDYLHGSLGGHVVCVVGIDLARGMALVANSWGTAWGCQPRTDKTRGYCYIPLEYLEDTNLASDFWSIDMVGYAP